MINGYSKFLYQIGMLDENESKHFEAKADYVTSLIKKKQFAEAFKVISCYMHKKCSLVFYILVQGMCMENPLLGQVPITVIHSWLGNGSQVIMNSPISFSLLCS